MCMESKIIVSFVECLTADLLQNFSELVLLITNKSGYIFDLQALFVVALCLIQYTYCMSNHQTQHKRKAILSLSVSKLSSILNLLPRIRGLRKFILQNQDLYIIQQEKSSKYNSELVCYEYQTIYRSSNNKIHFSYRCLLSLITNVLSQI